MGYNVQLRFLLQLYFVAACLGFFLSETENEGKLEPLDPELCISQDITFTCTLESPPVTGHSLGFAVKNSSTNRNFVPVEEERVDFISPTVANLTLYNITIKTFVKCFYWENFGDLDETNKLGYTSTIVVYPMPEELEEMNCIVDNYLDGMNCSWAGNHSEKIKPKVLFQWRRIPSFNQAWNNCVNLNEEYKYCYWSSSQDGDFTMKTIEIQLVQMAKCGVNVSSNFIVDTQKIVKPKPVTGLTSYAVNSTCIYVQWSTNNSKQQYIKEHRVNITNQWDKPRLYTFNTTNVTEKYVHNKTFCDLHPYTKYTYSVSVLPIGDQAGFFSDPRQTAVQTYSDIPSASPEVVSGGFSWNPKDCETRDATRRICVPLKPIRPIDQNGQMKGLVVTYANVKTGEHHETNLAEDLRYVCHSLKCSNSYRFYIKARNGNGTSAVNSSIEISPSTLGIKQPQFIVEAGDGTNVSVSWPETVEANTFMVFWCRNRNGQCQDKKDFNWEEFSGNTTEAVIQIEKTNSPQDFLYGVSVLTDQGSSGFAWQECVYLKNANPQREVKNLAVSPGPEDNSLVVTWDKLTCQSDEPYIDQYNIQYNKVNDKHYTGVNVSASGEARKVLYDLERDQAYNVSVRAITKTGQFGPVGQSQIVTPVDKSLRQWELALIVIGVLAGIALVVLSVIFFMRKYRKTKEMIEDTKNITIPKDESMDGNQNFGIIKVVRQNSNDSGYDPMTPPPDRYVEQPPYNHLPKPNMQFENTPDGYCKAMVGNSQTPIENSTPQTMYLPFIDSRSNFIPPEPHVGTVAFVFEERNTSSGETMVKKPVTEQSDNTAVKTRVKNDSGDSGVSETLAKEILDTSETDVKCRMNENVDEKNSNTTKSKEVSDYVSAENTSDPSGNMPGNISFPNGSSLSSLGGSENTVFSTDLSTGSKTSSNLNTAPDYARAHAGQDNLNTQSSSGFNQTITFPNAQSTIIDVDNALHVSHFPENDVQNCHNAEERSSNSLDNKSVPLLTVIPTPACMGESISQNELNLNDKAKHMAPEQMDITDTSMSMLDSKEDGKIENVNESLPHVELNSILSHLSKTSVNNTDEIIVDTAVQDISDFGSNLGKDHLLDSVQFNEGQDFPDNVRVSDEQSLSDYVQTTDAPHTTDSISTNENFPDQQMADQQHLADYVQTTDQPTFIDNSFNMSKKQNISDSEIFDSYSSLPTESNLTLPSSTSDQTDVSSPYNVSNISAQENNTPTLNTGGNSDPSCSDSVSLSLGGYTYVLPAFASVELQPTNIFNHSTSFDNYSSAETSSLPICSASPPVSSIGYISLPDALQSQTSSVASSEIPSYSMDNNNSLNQFQNPIYQPEPNENTAVKGINIPVISNGYVSYPCPDGILNFDPPLITTNHITENSNSVPVTPAQDPSGYVFTTDIPSTSSNVPLDNSVIGGQSTRESSCTGGPSSRESPRTNDPLDSIRNDSNTKSSCQVPNTNGYVDLKFISEGNLNGTSLVSKKDSNANVLMEMANQMNDGNDHITNNTSDLASLEGEDSGTDNITHEGGFNGYVSSEFAMERL